MTNPTFESMLTSAAEAADLLKALAHDTRLMALCLLIDAERTVHELETALGTSQSSVSQHLTRLRDRGIVECRREGKNIYYRIKDQRVLEIVKTMHRLFCSNN